MQQYNFAVIDDEPKELYFQKSRLYEVNDELDLREIIVNSLEHRWSRGLRGSIEQLVRDSSLRERDDFQTDSYILNCKNCFVDLKNQRIIDEDIPSLIQIYTNYKPELRPSEIFENALKESNDMSETILEFIVRSRVYGTLHTRKMMFLTGKTSSGKSLVINTIQNVFGTSCVSAVEIQKLQ